MQPADSTALHVVNHISVMVAYWSADLKCVFANDAYRACFGRAAAEITDVPMAEFPGPQYGENLRYIRGALAGQVQIFKCQFQLPDGRIGNGITTYRPDFVDGAVVGFSDHVADVTALFQREAELAGAVAEAIEVLKKTRRSFRSKELGLLRERLEQMSQSWGERLRGCPMDVLKRGSDRPDSA